MKQGTKITKYTGKAIPVEGNDIDTDRIIPARFMRCVTFRGLGKYAMYDVRYDNDGNEKNHAFNKPEYNGNSILVVNKNFGCGSSREHAPWALYDFGVRMIIGESFAEIFAGNCNSLGIPAVTVDSVTVHELQTLVTENPGAEIVADLQKKTLYAAGKQYSFDMPETYRLAMINGQWDTTSILLSASSAIEQKSGELPYLNW